MITQTDAEQRVEKLLAKLAYGDAYLIVRSSTLEFDWGWVFFYNSRRYIETQNDSFALLGNAPLIVSKYTGAIIETGTTHDIDHYIDLYLQSIGSSIDEP